VRSRSRIETDEPGLRRRAESEPRTKRHSSLSVLDRARGKVVTKFWFATAERKQDRLHRARGEIERTRRRWTRGTKRTTLDTGGTRRRGGRSIDTDGTTG